MDLRPNFNVTDVSSSLVETVQANVAGCLKAAGVLTWVQGVESTCR